MLDYKLKESITREQLENKGFTFNVNNKGIKVFGKNRENIVITPERDIKVEIYSNKIAEDVIMFVIDILQMDWLYKAY